MNLLETTKGGVSEILKVTAVVPYFDPEALRTRFDASALADLADLAAVTTSEGKPRWALQLAARRQVLRALAETGVLSRYARAAARDGESAIEALMRTVLAGHDWPDPTKMNSAALEDFLKIAEWTEGVPGVASAQVTLARQLLDQETRLKPLVALSTENFIGRDKEKDLLLVALGRLRPNAGPLRPSGRGKLIVVTGPGGIGKTTLAGAAIDEVRRREEPRPPIVYVDFDRSDIDAEDPASYGFEILRQLAPGLALIHRDQMESLNAIVERTRDELFPADRTGASEESWTEPPYSAPQTKRSTGCHIAIMASAFKQLPAVPHGAIIVLDTVERVQTVGHVFVQLLQEFGDMLLRFLQASRIILLSRVGGIAPDEVQIPLDDLQSEEAAELFHRLSGVPVRQSLEIVAEVGTRPLAVRLAARVFQLDHMSVKDFHRLRDSFLNRLFRQELIIGILQRRVLGHLADAEVRRLVDPGLVLRRLDASVLLEVLREPCNLGISTLEEARRLLDALAQERTVVRRINEVPGVVMFQESMRGECYAILRRTEPDRVISLHKRAAAYYAARRIGDISPPDLTSRAEEIYHRAALGATAETLAGLYLPGVEIYLWELTLDQRFKGGPALRQLLPADGPPSLRGGGRLPGRLGEVMLAKEIFDRISAGDSRAHIELETLLARGEELSPDLLAATVLSKAADAQSSATIERFVTLQWAGLSAPPPTGAFLTLACFATASRRIKKQDPIWTDLRRWAGDFRLWSTVMRDFRALVLMRNLLRLEVEEFDAELSEFVQRFLSEVSQVSDPIRNSPFELMLLDTLVEAGRFAPAQALRTTLWAIGAERFVSLFGWQIVTLLGLAESEGGPTSGRPSNWRRTKSQISTAARRRAFLELPAKIESEPVNAPLIVFLLRTTFRVPPLDRYVSSFVAAHRGSPLGDLSKAMTVMRRP